MNRSWKRFPRAALATCLALVVLLIAAAPGRAAQEFDPDSILQNARFKADLQKMKSDAEAQQAITTHGNQAFGFTKTVFDFAAALAGGDYTEQIDDIMNMPVQQWNANRGMYGSYELVNVQQTIRRNQSSSLFGSMKDNMSNLALGLSVYSIMKDVSAGYNGDNSAKLKAVKGTYDVVSGYWASKIGWNSLGTAMIGVGVISYALDRFQAEAQTQYTDYWWNAYSQWLNGEYPDLVTGPNSWAEIARRGGDAAVQRRLYEFWDAPYDNAVKYYGQSRLQTPPAMAELQFKDKFAGRYYFERVHTTLKTFYQNEAEKAEALAWYQADKAYRDLLALIADLEKLRLAIDDAGKFQPEEEEEEPTPVSLILRPGARTIEVEESVTFTAWYVFEDHSLKQAFSNVTWAGAASSATFVGTEPGDFRITATANGLSGSAEITVREQTQDDDDEEEEIEDVIEEIQDPEDDYCTAAGIARMRSTLAGQIGQVQSKSSVISSYRTKFDKELADRAADPCGNTLMAYCYQQASQVAGDIDYLVDEIRSQASALLMQMSLCPDEADASGPPYTIADVIRDIAKAGDARREASAALAAMQSRLGENGCDEDEFDELADRYTEDGNDPDGLQDGSNMGEIAGDGVDNDQDGRQEEDWSEVAGKVVTIVVFDSGSAADDSFGLSVQGLGSLGATPVGGLRTYGVDLPPGTHTATITVLLAPDNIGTFTATAVQNGVEIGGTSGEPPQGSSVSFTFTVVAPN